MKLHNCHDCGAEPGKVHMPGCDVERCSVCGMQRLMCQDECDEHDPVFSRWTGLWPGLAESKELGCDLNEFYEKEYYKSFFIKPIEKV